MVELRFYSKKSTILEDKVSEDGRHFLVLKPEIVDWLNEHVGGWSFTCGRPGYYRGGAAGVIMFDREEDCLAFRLAWLS